MTKNHTKTLVFTTLDTSQLKKMMILRVCKSFRFACWSCKRIYWRKKWKWILIFDSVDENKELLKKYNDVWNRIKSKIKELSSDECDYEKDYMKIRFNSDDDIPLNKPLKFHLITIIIRCVFSEGGKFYPQLLY